MRLLKQAMAVLGSVVVIAVVVALVTPKAAHAIVATMVDVVNTPSQPVLTLETDAQTAFVATNFCAFGAAPAVSADTCALEPLYTVPAGKTAVIESASGVCVMNASTTAREFQLQFTGPTDVLAQLSFPPSPAVSSLGTFTVSTTAQNIKSYASGGAAGTAINFHGFASAAQTAFSGGGSPFCGFTVSGHLVSTQ